MMIPIQASVSGFGGKPLSLFSAYDPDSQVLVISAEAEFRRERRDGCVVLTNDPSIPRDSLFTDADLRDGINAFFSLNTGVASDSKSPRLKFSERAARVNPSAAIEKDGIDMSGARYRLSDAITCGHVAAIVTCWYAYRKAGAIQSMLSMSDSLVGLRDRLYSGEIITF